MNLGEYLNKHKPTQKQLMYISSIQEYTSAIFRGETKQEAFEFISKYAHNIPKHNYMHCAPKEYKDEKSPMTYKPYDVGPYGEITYHTYAIGPYGEIYVIDDGDGDAYGW